MLAVAAFASTAFVAVAVSCGFADFKSSCVLADFDAAAFFALLFGTSESALAELFFGAPLESFASAAVVAALALALFAFAGAAGGSAATFLAVGFISGALSAAAFFGAALFFAATGAFFGAAATFFTDDFFLAAKAHHSLFYGSNSLLRCGQLEPSQTPPDSCYRSSGRVLIDPCPTGAPSFAEDLQRRLAANAPRAPTPIRCEQKGRVPSAQQASRRRCSLQAVRAASAAKTS